MSSTDDWRAVFLDRVDTSLVSDRQRCAELHDVFQRNEGVG